MSGRWDRFGLFSRLGFYGSGSRPRKREVCERRVVLRKLTEEESYARHVAQDHVPYRKGCPICIGAQGRQRSHWRSSFPGVHSLSVDVAAPLIPGRSWDVEASGRDKGQGYRFFLACAYTIPGGFTPSVDPVPAEGVGTDSTEWEAMEPEVPLVIEGGVGDIPLDDPDDGDLMRELDQIPLSFEEVARVKAVTRRVKYKRPEDEAPAASSGDLSIKTRKTLFIGVPLRTKTGKEVLHQIQGVINRLESSGFPIQRYHADRAKELRSHSLISWLKNKGIHTTWTAGESPAANRAELGVQVLKAFVRKLLFASGLDKDVWPLALLHGSARNWLNFNEAAGIPQLPLLPFGLKVHARRRTRTGYEAQWESRTVEGVYVGPAPHTPGGHLVLVPGAEGDGSKVLLTNTVYPLSGTSATMGKPKYRLCGKRSPPFALRVVAAADAPGSGTVFSAMWLADSHGGESFLDGFDLSKNVYGDENVGFVDGVESGVVEEKVAYVGFGNGTPLSENEGDETFLEGFPLSVKGLHGDVREWIQGLVQEGEYSARECLEVLNKGLCGIPVARRPMLQGQGRALLLGLYGLGGFRGVSRATFEYAEVVRYLNKFMLSQRPAHLWTALYVSRNTVMPLHRDLRNAKGFNVMVRAVGDFTGGGLWIEGNDGEGLVCKKLPDGKLCPGTVHDVKNEPVVFSGTKWHAPEACVGESRWVISAFVPRDIEGTTEDQWDSLRELGFPVDGVIARRATSTKLGEASVDKVVPMDQEVSWEVTIPVPFWEDVHLGWDHLHQCTSRLCRFWAGELREAVDLESGVMETAWQLRRAETMCEGLEKGLNGWDEGCLVGALQVEVPIGDEGSSDQFLQTRTVD